MELCNVLKGQEEGADKGKKNLLETAMDEAHPEDEDEEEEVEEKGAKTEDGNQDMPAAEEEEEEEQRATSEAVREKSHMTH